MKKKLNQKKNNINKKDYSNRIDILKKILTNKYFIFAFAVVAIAIDIIDKDIIFGSGDATETMLVIKSFFYKNKYGSYVMYKGLYSFLPGLASYWFGRLTCFSTFFLLKSMKCIVFAYVTAICIPYIIEKMFKCEVKCWQKYLFIISMVLFERGTIYFVSVDSTSFFVFMISIKLMLNLLEKNSYIKLLIFSLLVGIGANLSGQYSISLYILLGYFLITTSIKYKKQISKIVIILLISISCIAITKGANIYYEKTVVNKEREKGAWIPSGHDWAMLSLSAGFKSVAYPPTIDDTVSMNFIKTLGEDTYNKVSNMENVFTPKTYIILILKHPVFFIFRWTERLFLGLINSPVNKFGPSCECAVFVISIMGASIYVLWKYIKDNLKRLKDLISLQSIVFIAVLFSALVPSFWHMENRYYISSRASLLAVLFMSPLLYDYIIKIKNKKVKLTNINMDIVSCIVFVIICIVAYVAICQNIESVITMF